MSDIKQVIVIRKDLNMRKGKMCSQAAHAAMGFLLSEKGEFDEVVSNWLLQGQTKITLQIESEEELVALCELAQSKGLRCNLVTDAGRTEFGGVPTKTKSEKIDKLTGHLKLF
jgi:PTH2 family peptidyl-tRNA hydrolase